MTSEVLHALWARIRTDLRRAAETLPEGDGVDPSMVKYHEYLVHNELELACDMLERLAEGRTVTREFWLSLQDAAAKMALHDRARRYGERATAKQSGPG